MIEGDLALEGEEPGHGEVGVPDEAGEGASEADAQPREGGHARHGLKIGVILKYELKCHCAVCL